MKKADMIKKLGITNKTCIRCVMHNDFTKMLAFDLDNNNSTGAYDWRWTDGNGIEARHICSREWRTGYVCKPCPYELERMMSSEG